MHVRLELPRSNIDMALLLVNLAGDARKLCYDSRPDKLRLLSSTLQLPTHHFGVDSMIWICL